MLNLLLCSICLAADYTPATSATVSPDGRSVTLAWTQPGGWPADMVAYQTAILVLDVDGVPVQAEVGGIAWTQGDTVYISRLLSRQVYRGQSVEVVRVEAGTAHSESMSDEWRTWEIADTKAVNGSRVSAWAVPWRWLIQGWA